MYEPYDMNIAETYFICLKIRMSKGVAGFPYLPIKEKMIKIENGLAEMFIYSTEIAKANTGWTSVQSFACLI